MMNYLRILRALPLNSPIASPVDFVASKMQAICIIHEFFEFDLL